jgi:hypothetical protein
MYIFFLILIEQALKFDTNLERKKKSKRFDGFNFVNDLLFIKNNESKHSINGLECVK